MAHIIIHYNGAYNLYSTVVDEPLYESAISEEQLRLHVKLKDGESGLAALPERIDRAKKFGSSSFLDSSLHSVVDRNRAGVSGIRMTFNAFVDKYLTLPKPVLTEPGKSWTGQPIVDATRELVLCATCKSASHPVGLHSDAWYDPFIAYGTRMGAYVHYGCLSAQRKAELETHRLGEKK